MKIASVVGARPNFIKLAPIHRAIKNICSHTIIHTGQHYDYNLSKIFFKEFELPYPDYDLEVGSATAGSQIGDMIRKLDQIFSETKFDMVLVYGDTNSTLAGALAANKSETKIGHIEAGLRSMDRTMPEEINRILTDQISDYLFASTENSIYNLRNENIVGKIFDTGDLSVEIVEQAKILSNTSAILKNLDLEDKPFVLLTIHRAENTKTVDKITPVIKAIEALSDIQIVFPIHPRTYNFLKQNNLSQEMEKLSNLKIIEPVGYIDFIQLIRNSTKVITDSGGVQKESYLLGIPCITIRNSTEWIETVKEGWNILIGTDFFQTVDAVRKWKIPSSMSRNQIFGNGNTSSMIVEIIRRNII